MGEITIGILEEEIVVESWKQEQDRWSMCANVVA
jgi:hypothetical protein